LEFAMHKLHTIEESSSTRIPAALQLTVSCGDSLLTEAAKKNHDGYSLCILARQPPRPT
jgi:hypothetical protein